LQEETILNELGADFTRADAINAGAKHKIPPRTVDDKLFKWQKKKIIRRVSNGVYKKL